MRAADAHEQDGLLGRPDVQLSYGGQEESSSDAGRRAPPLWVWPMLVASVLAVSSAGVAFSFLKEVPPITLAAWRLQLTSVLLATGAVPQLCGMSPHDRAKTVRSAALVAGSGAALAVHFGAWVTSLELTSLTHSLLFVSATPILLAAGAWLLSQPISSEELAGTAVGAVGTIVLAAGATSEADVTLQGDAAAMLASAAIIPYLVIGRRLRAWMPLCVYAAPVTGLAAALLTAGGAVAEGSTLFKAGKHGLFGWAASAHYFQIVSYLAIVPGIVGHTGVNALLRHVPPLVIALSFNMEPLLGSILGHFAGVAAPPGALTYIGGGLVFASTVAVTLAANRREETESARACAAAKIHRVMTTPLEEL